LIPEAARDDVEHAVVIDVEDVGGLESLGGNLNAFEFDGHGGLDWERWWFDEVAAEAATRVLLRRGVLLGRELFLCFRQELDVLVGDLQVLQAIGWAAQGCRFAFDGLEKVGGLLAHAVNPWQRGCGGGWRLALAGIAEHRDSTRTIDRQRRWQFELDPSLFKGDERFLLPVQRCRVCRHLKGAGDISIAEQRECNAGGIGGDHAVIFAQQEADQIDLMNVIIDEADIRIVVGGWFGLVLFVRVHELAEPLRGPIARGMATRM